MEDSVLNDIWLVSTVVGLILQSVIVVEEWYGLQALKHARRNGAARAIARANIEADGMRWIILAILTLVGRHLPLQFLDGWVAMSLLTVIWMTTLIAVRTTLARRRVLRIVIAEVAGR